jgi:alkylation response protein AidB-like acyl-CoA dehydrogenase
MRDELWMPLRESAARFTAEIGAAKAFDRARWRKIAALGWLSLAVPEDMGGSGLAVSDLIPIVEGLGAGCLPDPVIAVAGVAVPLLAVLGSDHLSSIITGERIAVLAHGEINADDAGVLRGSATTVVGGADADMFIAAAQMGDGATGFFILPRDGGGLTVSASRSIDGRFFADLALDQVCAQRLGSGDASNLLDTAVAHGAMLTIADAAGAMDALLSDTLAYLKTRKQFGQPIASFQALQHRAVDMYLALEETKAVIEAAANAEASDGFASAVAAAKVVGVRAARRIGREAIQLHGGMGLSEELRVGRLFRRLVAGEGHYGDADSHLARFMKLTEDKAA